MSAALEIIARAVVIRDGRLLVVRDVGAAWFFLPGGHVEAGEAVEAALVRELREELGCAATIAGFVGAVEYGYTSAGRDRRELNLVFEAGLDAPAPDSQEDHLEFSWVPMSGLAEITLRPEPLRAGVRQWAGNRVPFWRGLRG